MIARPKLITRMALLTAASLMALPTLSHAQATRGSTVPNQPGASEYAPGQRAKATRKPAKTFAPGQKAKKTGRPAKTFAPGQQDGSATTGPAGGAATRSR